MEISTNVYKSKKILWGKSCKIIQENGSNVPNGVVVYVSVQVISHKSLKESYQTMPRSEILFEHDNGRNRDFFCTFELTADNTTTKITAVASIKEVRLNENSAPCPDPKVFKIC